MPAPKPKKTTLVEDFLALLKSLDPNYTTKVASVDNRPRFDRLYRELSRSDENAEARRFR
jgi:hypothetical protein